MQSCSGDRTRHSTMRRDESRQDKTTQHNTTQALTRRERFGHCEKALLTAMTASSHLASLVSLLLLLLFSTLLTVPPETETGFSSGSLFLNFSDSCGSLSEASAISCNRPLPSPPPIGISDSNPAQMNRVVKRHNFMQGDRSLR